MLQESEKNMLFKRYLPYERDVTPNDFPCHMHVIEERSKGAARDGVDFRTKKVVVHLPMMVHGEERIVNCSVNPDTGRLIWGMYNVTDYWLKPEHLQLARREMDYPPLTQEQLTDLEEKSRQMGYKEVTIEFPRVVIPTRRIPQRKQKRGFLARILGRG